MTKYVVVYFDTRDRLQMYQEGIIGSQTMAQLICSWAEECELDYIIQRIESLIDEKKTKTVIGYRLKEEDSLIFKMRYNLSKVRPIIGDHYSGLEIVWDPKYRTP